MILSSGLYGSGVPVGPRKLVLRLYSAQGNPRFSLCILVTNWQQFNDCLTSFRRCGFDDTCCEILVIDNSVRNQADAYVGLNEFLQAADGDYVILMHQDVTLIDDGRIELELRLKELTELDPRWGLCGNAGCTPDATPVLFLSHPVSDDHICGGPFPAAVGSLDENFIVVRKAANLALSRDLQGFHHYGADLCIIADILGWTAYVIAFKLRHHSGGTVDESYCRSGRAISRKYAVALRSRWVNLVTERPFYISGSRVSSARAHASRLVSNGLRRARIIAGAIRIRLREKWR